jgi:hypothetical protein
MGSPDPASGSSPNLLQVKLRALARAATGAEVTEIDPSLGAAMAGDVAFYLAEADPRALGRALHWALSRGASRVEILASGVGPELARRAALLTGIPGPTIGVWTVTGAQVAPAVPEPAPEPPILPASQWALAGLITEAGARPVDDHGLLVAEVAGLEVARVVGDIIEVGVGQADRELSALIHTNDDVNQGLQRVVATVVQHRASRGDSHHPLTRLARERWLRAVLLDHPELVDATELAPLVPLRPRRGLVRSEPSPAAGRLRSGRPVVVVCMVGVDPDLIPEAADYRQRWDPDAAVVLVLPERDLGLSTRLLNRLPNATAQSVPAPWEA